MPAHPTAGLAEATNACGGKAAFPSAAWDGGCGVEHGGGGSLGNLSSTDGAREPSHPARRQASSPPVRCSASAHRSALRAPLPAPGLCSRSPGPPAGLVFSGRCSAPRPLAFRAPDRPLSGRRPPFPSTLFPATTSPPLLRTPTRPPTRARAHTRVHHFRTHAAALPALATSTFFPPPPTPPLPRRVESPP
jgi:hypothetical protein